jgi:hypothetical protein
MADELPPVWLLDVDGVINGDPPRVAWTGPHAVAEIRTPDDGRLWTIRWAPELITAILGIHQAGLADIRWATTWCPHVHLLEDLWGLPELPRTWTDGLYGYDANDAKIIAARAVLADGRRLIWTDDNVFPAYGWPDTDLLTDGRALLIKPFEDAGLRPGHLELIRAFAAGEPGPSTVVWGRARRRRSAAR